MFNRSFKKTTSNDLFLISPKTIYTFQSEQRLGAFVS